jgi:hypothetical protein
MLLYELAVTDATVKFYTLGCYRMFRETVHNPRGIQYADVAWSTHRPRYPLPFPEIGKYGDHN